MQKLSAIVTCYNEQEMLPECLDSLAFADELIVVDSFSTDKTPEIARKKATRFAQHEYLYPAAQKNWIIPQATHEWVLILDADERVPAELQAEIRTIIQKPEHDGYWIRRRNFFWGREIKHGTWRTDKVLRLFRRDRGRYEDKKVHEEVRLASPAGWCRERLDHYSYRSLEDFIKKAGRYGTWGAQDAQARGIRSSGPRIFGHAAGHFLKSYFLKRGFLDGTAGLVIAFMQGYHAFCKYGRLYELQRSGGHKLS